jgi:hypothetical protein
MENVLHCYKFCILTKSKNKKMRKSLATAKRSVTLPATVNGAITSLKKKTALLGSSSLEWYRLTESAMHVLNSVIVKNAHEEIAESNKANPDQDKIRELKLKISKVIAITRDTKNFESKARMQQLLEEYSK